MRPSRLTFALVLVLAPALAAQTSGKFITLKGKDTLAVETFTRDVGTLTVQLSQSNGNKTEYIANLRADQSVEHLEFQRTNLQGLSATLSVDFGDTLIAATITQAEKSQSLKLPVTGRPNPYLQASPALFEQIVRANPLAVGKSARVMVVRMGVPDTVTVTLTRVHADSVVVDAPNGAMRLAVNKDGDVIGAVFPSAQWVIERKKQ